VGNLEDGGWRDAQQVSPLQQVLEPQLIHITPSSTIHSTLPCTSTTTCAGLSGHWARPSLLRDLSWLPHPPQNRIVSEMTRKYQEVSDLITSLPYLFLPALWHKSSPTSSLDRGQLLLPTKCLLPISHFLQNTGAWSVQAAAVAYDSMEPVLCHFFPTLMGTPRLYGHRAACTTA
jgi:hypothetical protein